MIVLEKEHKGLSTWLAFMLIPLGGLATDIFLPSLPGMGRYLNVSQSAVQLLVILFMTSSGLSQIFIGGILDSLGRYRINLISLLAFSLVSFLITIIPNIYVIYGLRIVQGIAVSLIIVGKRAYFVDLYSGNRLRHFTSLFSVVWATAPVIAPFIGGYLEHNYGWRSNFHFLALFTLMMFVLEFLYSGESLPVQERSPFKLSKILGIYKSMLGTRDFSLGLLIIGTNYSLQILYSISSPFLIEEQFHHSPITTGNSALILGLALMAGGLVSKAMIHIPLRRKLNVAIILEVILSLAMNIVSIRYSSLYTLVGMALFINFISGFIFNNVYSYCLRRFGANAGAASGLTGGGIYVISSIMNFGLISSVTISSQLVYSYLNLGLVGLMAIAILGFLSHRKARSIDHE